MSFFSWLFRRNKPKKITLGLALGSGGAKGFAHLGAIKAFEESDIEFDVVAGASIGSIVGAFYADGYSATDIMELLKRINLGEIKKSTKIKIDTSAVFRVIDREIGSLNIEDLKKPFRAIATEEISNEEHVFDSGNVATALCASSCIPPFFRPVTIDGVRYVDGAFSNSVPADVVRSLGADYVVGIDLSTRDTKPSPIMKFLPTYKSKISEPWTKGYKFSDTIIHPDLNGFSSIGFTRGAEMFDIGYQTAKSFIPKIKDDIHALQYPKSRKKSKDKSEKKDKSKSEKKDKSKSEKKDKSKSENNSD